MPSPFPGMDPYLEHPAQWPNLHHRLITTIGTVLNAVLPPRYVASIGEQLYVAQAERRIYPDSEEIREGFIEILTVGDQSRLVTVAEVLSPANKSSGTEGRELYRTKQHELLRSQTHLIEIDLLRQGEHTVAPPIDYLIERGYWDYLVSLHRGGHGARFEVWAVPLRQRLPRIHVPLADDDPDIVLDLQAVFDRCYDEGALSRRLDYGQPPHTPLKPADAEWADALLRERGLRA